MDNINNSISGEIKKSKVLESIENKKDNIYKLIDLAIKEQVQDGAEAKYTYGEQMKNFIIDLNKANNKKEILKVTGDLYDWLYQGIGWERIDKYPSFAKVVEKIHKQAMDKRNSLFENINPKGFNDFINNINERNLLIIEKSKKRGVENKGISGYLEAIKNIEVLKEQSKNPGMFGLYEYSQESSFKKELSSVLKYISKINTTKGFGKDTFIEKELKKLKEFYK